MSFQFNVCTRQAIFGSFTNFVDSARFDLVLHSPSYRYRSFVFYSFNDGLWDEQNNKETITEGLMKCNYDMKKLVNLGLAACNCYPYHIEYDKGKMSRDVTCRQI